MWVGGGEEYEIRLNIQCLSHTSYISGAHYLHVAVALGSAEDRSFPLSPEVL